MRGGDSAGSISGVTTGCESVLEHLQRVRFDPQHFLILILGLLVPRGKQRKISRVLMAREMVLRTEHMHGLQEPWTRFLTLRDLPSPAGNEQGQE